MPFFRSDHVEVYVFRRRGRRIEFLTLRRARGHLAGVWQPVTGTRRRGERALAAARREVREETGVVPRRWWRLEDVLLFFDAGRDAFQLVPRFAAEVGGDVPVRISREHDAAAFLTATEAARRCLWESQRRALRAVRHDIVAGGAAARALALGSRAGHGPIRRRTKAPGSSRTHTRRR